jgi:SNF2 family DNA or RNA helicase
MSYGPVNFVLHRWLTSWKSEKTFDPDEFQKFQPGFKMCLDPEFIQQGTNTVSASSVSAESEQNRELNLGVPTRRRTRKFGDGHICEFDRDRSDGTCNLCLELHDGCNFMNPKSQCDVCYRVAESCPEDESKSFYLVNKLLQLYNSQQTNRRLGCRPLKVIVFSQFRKMLNVIGHRLLKQFGAGCVGEYFGIYRKQELRKFTCDPLCFCLLLTKDGAEGLDLSFVTNIIFLDEIFDKSLREQAVARAWRMGATGSVKVETLVAKNSVEESMGEIDAHRASLDARSEPDKERVKALLASLRLNTDYHYFARNETMDVPASARKRKLIVVSNEAAVVPPRPKRVKFCL